MVISAQKYKIWINTSWMIFMTPDLFRKLDFKGIPMVCLLQSPSTGLIHDYMHYMMDGVVQMPVIITSKGLPSLWKKILKKVPIVYAAGGMVQRLDGKYLFIYRRGWWDLPKGKLDKGETNRNAAKREVMEEVGLNCKIISTLPTTFHCYYDKKILVMKETAWYRMVTIQTKPILQSEEDITDSKWVSKAGLIRMKPKLYANLKVLVEEVE